MADHAVSRDNRLDWPITQSDRPFTSCAFAAHRKRPPIALLKCLACIGVRRSHANMMVALVTFA